MFMLVAFVAFCFLVALFAAYSLLTPALFTHAKPKTKNKVLELTCDGVLAQWLLGRKWGASTIPLPFVTLILYWVRDSAMEHPNGPMRMHEFVHVAQAEKCSFFLVSWVKYFYELISQRFKAKSWMDAYKLNKYEVEARQTVHDIILGLAPMPDWANE